MKSEINDQIITYFSTFQQKKKKKLKEILEKRNNIDRNCQLALNCIYTLNQGTGAAPTNIKHKSAMNSIRKEGSKNRQRDSASRAKITKNIDYNNRYKKIKSSSNCNRKDVTTTQTSSANRSGSKVSNRVTRRGSKIKIKRTGTRTLIIVSYLRL